MDASDRAELCELLLPEIRRAGLMALEIRAKGLKIREKADRSPATAADTEIEAVLSAVLMRLCPAVPVIGEEAAAKNGAGLVVTAPFFLIDPIDGTREFIAGRDDFAVNVALVEEGYPTLGIVSAPAAGRCFIATAPGQAYLVDGTGGRSRLHAFGTASRGHPVILASRSHLDSDTRKLISAFWPCAVLKIGSSLKFASLAVGEADLYPRLAPTMAWDTAAGQALVEAAGGVVLDVSGSRLAYRPGQLRNDGFIAARTAGLAEEGLRQVRQTMFVPERRRL